MLNQIYSTQELVDRYNFHHLIDAMFIICHAGKGDYANGISHRVLYDIYQHYYPQNGLSTDVIKLLLLVGGFIDNEEIDTKIYARLNISFFVSAEDEIQKKLMWGCNQKTANLLMQIRNGIVYPDAIEVTTDTALVRRFIEIFCITKINKHYHLLKTLDRSSSNDVYNYYMKISIMYNCFTVDRKIFSKELEGLGHMLVKGCVDGSSGRRFFAGLFIPKRQSDIELSLQLGMCIITPNKGNTVTSINKLFADILPVEYPLIQAENNERWQKYEPAAKKIKESEENSFSGRKDETREVIDSTAEKTTKATEKAAEGEKCLSTSNERPEEGIQRDEHKERTSSSGTFVPRSIPFESKTPERRDVTKYFDSTLLGQ